MSTGWSWWVMSLVTFNMGVTFFLFLWAPWAKVPTVADGTTGHSWAGGTIREGVKPLPLWWLLLSCAMFIAAFIYLVLYPGFGNNPGRLGWSAHGEHDQAAAATQARLQPVMQQLAGMSVAQASRDPRALQIGARLFGDNCAACHGRQGQGNQELGAPDLTDTDSLYGRDADSIVASITDGRSGSMPAWKSLGNENVRALTHYVLQLSGQTHDAYLADQGRAVFASNCVACHGPQGHGNPAMGAPNLTDKVWLHGGRPGQIKATISNGRQGHMPAWNERLTNTQIHVVAAYVYQLSPHP